MDAREAFRALAEKFHLFLIFPQKTMAERKGNIHAEIRARVTAAGGVVDGVDIRASLLWNSRNDLDLHVVTPAGEHQYGSETGQLRRLARRGHERARRHHQARRERAVGPRARPDRSLPRRQNYAFHEQEHKPTPYKVELR